MSESAVVEKQEGGDIKSQADVCIAEGKKAIALKQWEEGVNKYAEALDLMRQLVGDFDPQMAPLLLSYGKALYELAFSQQGVMGKEEIAKEASGSGAEEPANPNSKNFVFEADPISDEEDADDTLNQDPDTSLAQTEGQPEATGSGTNGGGEGDDVEDPEDDYNAAWEVLDVARTIYLKVVEGFKEGEGKETRLVLADCYLALGDVSCETENFPQAVQDYKSALSIITSLQPPSSRTTTSTHYQLATALEFTQSGRTEALQHLQSALEGLQQRVSELTNPSSTTVGGENKAEKYKSEKEVEDEVKDVKEMIGDLEVKIEELKSGPENGDLVSESIEHLLGGGTSSSTSGTASKEPAGPINDLTSMVRKKAPKPKAVVGAVASAVSAAIPSNGEAVLGKALETAKESVGEVLENGKKAVEEVVGGIKRKAEEVGEIVEKKLKTDE